MADENRENNDENKKDENDPYKFFKFAGPVNNDDDDKDKKRNNKKRPKISFFTILLIIFCAFAIIDIFFVSRNDDYIGYSEFRDKVANGQIVSVEIGENTIIGYGPSAQIPSGNSKGMQFLSSRASLRSGQQYKTSAVLMQSFIDLLDEKGIPYKFAVKSNGVFWQLLGSLIIPLGF